MFFWKNIVYTLRHLLQWLENRSFRRILRSLLWGGLLSLVIWVVSIILFKPFNIDIFYERMFFLYGLEDPELMSRLGIADRYGLDFFNAKLTDISEQQNRQFDQEFIRRNLDMLQAYKRSEQSEQQLISTDILTTYLENQILYSAAINKSYLVNHINGVQVELPRFMVEVHEVDDIHDANNYLKRLAKFSPKIDQLIAGLEKRQREGIVAPRFVIDKVLIEIRTFLTTNVEDNLLYRDFMYKINRAERIQRLAVARGHLVPTGDTVDVVYPELQTELGVVLADEVYPAYRRLYDFLKEQREIASGSAGSWTLSDGRSHYSLMLKVETTVDASPYELSDYAEDEIPLLQEEVKRCFHEIGLDTTKSHVELLAELDNDPRYQYTDDKAGQKAFFRDLRRQIDSTKALIPRFYPDVPPNLSFEVRPLPRYKENSSGLITYDQVEKTSVPVVYLNMRNIREIPKYSVAQMACKIVLGMHMQHFYKRKIADQIPTFRRVLKFDAFEEGWYAHINRRIWEMGIFADDPLSRLSILQHELYLTSIMAADIMLNFNEVPRNEVVDYLHEITGFSKVRLQEEVDKSVVVPGANCVPIVGQRRFELNRQRVEEQVNPMLFDERELNAFFLKNGEMPLPVIYKQVMKFVRARGGENEIFY